MHPIGEAMPGRDPADHGLFGLDSHRPLVRMLLRTTVMLALLTVSYYLLPDRRPVDVTEGSRSAGAIIGLAGAAFVVRIQVIALRRRKNDLMARIEALLTTLYLLILVFASTYYMLETTNEGQFVGIDDRTDALYFTVTVVATVGFGDIAPVGTGARLLVTWQMLFDVVFIGTAVRALGAAESARRSAVPPVPATPPPAAAPTASAVGEVLEQRQHDADATDDQRTPQ